MYLLYLKSLGFGNPTIFIFTFPPSSKKLLFYFLFISLSSLFLWFSLGSSMSLMPSPFCLYLIFYWPCPSNVNVEACASYYFCRHSSFSSDWNLGLPPPLFFYLFQSLRTYIKASVPFWVDFGAEKEGCNFCFLHIDVQFYPYSAKIVWCLWFIHLPTIRYLLLCGFIFGSSIHSICIYTLFCANTILR